MNNGCLNYKCNKKGGHGKVWCGALILTAGWSISKDYP